MDANDVVELASELLPEVFRSGLKVVDTDDLDAVDLDRVVQAYEDGLEAGQDLSYSVYLSDEEQQTAPAKPVSSGSAQVLPISRERLRRRGK